MLDLFLCGILTVIALAGLYGLMEMRKENKDIRIKKYLEDMERRKNKNGVNNEY